MMSAEADNADPSGDGCKASDDCTAGNGYDGCKAPLHWIGISGPTASGKSAAAMALAAELPIEIVSVDSALVYRGMDIGTAKPTAAERAAVPHHLIDIREPRESYDAGSFVADAKRLIDEIHSRGRMPLLVGGTMLYFKSLIEGIDTMPRADAALRARIEVQAADLGWPAMHARLALVDAATAARLAPNDSQRIQRALEVWHASGHPLSSFHSAAQRPVNALRTGAAQLISLEPRERGWLHTRIAKRFDAMLAAGFLQEVVLLRARGDLRAQLPAMRCVGYRQAWEMLDAADAGDAGDANGKCSRGELCERDLDELRLRSVAATRRLAKRQLTWLRGMRDRLVIAADAPDAAKQLVRHVVALTIGPGSHA